jgi:putative redox protein
MAETKVTVHYGGNDFFIGISPGGHAQVMETNGERASAASPVELLLVALGGCTGSDIVDILRKKRVQITDYRIEVKGERRTDSPRSFKTIRVRHIIEGHNISEAAVKHAVELSDSKYCSVAATLRPAAEISVSFEIIQEESVPKLAGVPAGS